MNKFDPNNYLKKQPIIVYNNNWVDPKIDFGSGLLRIFWTLQTSGYKNGIPSGIIRVEAVSPLGKRPPRDFEFKIYESEYMQTLDLSYLDLQYESYKLKFKNLPADLRRSVCKIWEYIPLMSTESYQPQSSQPIDLTPLIAATEANATAIASMTSSLSNVIESQPEAIANAIDNNQVIIGDVNIPLFGTTAIAIAALPANNKRIALTFRNECTAPNLRRIKLFTSTDPIDPNTLTFNSKCRADLAPPTGLGAKGEVISLADDEVEGYWYAIADGSGAKLTCSESRNV